MLEILSVIRMLSPETCALKVAKHFEHRVSVHREDHMLRIHFPDATCEMQTSDELLAVHIHSRSQQALARCRDMIAKNLRQVASEEIFETVWTGDVPESGLWPGMSPASARHTEQRHAA